MFGIAASFLLAFFTERALLIDWSHFRDEDLSIGMGERKHFLVPLSELFHLPCFEWSLKQPSIGQYEGTQLIDFQTNWSNLYESIFDGGGNPWSNSTIIRIRAWHDFSAAILLNPAFSKRANLFPQNLLMSAIQPEVPIPLTLVFRYLFSPNVWKYSATVKNDFDRLQKDVRESCPGSRFNGVHLRLRTVFADRKLTSYFPCLEKLIAVTGENCFFVASDSAESRAIVYPHLPKNAKLFSYNLSRSRETTEGLQAAILELFTLGSSRAIYGFGYSTYTDAGGAIQGVGTYGVHCDVHASIHPGFSCRTDTFKEGLKFIEVADINALEQRRRLGCILVEQRYNTSKPMQYNWDKNRGIRACVVSYMNATHVANFKNFIAQLEGKYFSVAGRTYPIVVFCPNLPDPLLAPLDDIKKRLDVKFVILEPWKTPNLLADESLKYDGDISHRNRFFSGAAFQHPALNDYTYCMKVDIDVIFKENLSKDPFVQMVDQGLNYAYVSQNSEGHKEGLDDVTRAFIRNNLIRPQSLHYSLEQDGRLAPNQFLTNVEIIRVEFIRNSKYMDYVKAVEKVNGFYTQGWEDGLIRSIGLALTTNPSNVGNFASFIQLA